MWSIGNRKVKAEKLPFWCVDNYIELQIIISFSDTKICAVKIQYLYVFNTIHHTEKVVWTMGSESYTLQYQFLRFLPIFVILG